MSTLLNKFFFDDVSEFYDQMIDFESALEGKTNNLKSFLSSNIKVAADIGCGSGIDSIALATIGMKVSAFDASQKMVERGEENAKRLDKTINFYNYTAQDIPNEFNSQFDFVCSLGNTVANIPPNDLSDSIKRFAEILNKNGKLLFHILNYEKIIKGKERIVNINKGENNYLIRFYDFEKDFINFNILKFDNSDTTNRKLISTKVYPHSLELFLQLLKENNFSKVEVFQDMKKTPFNSETSNDIYLFAERN